MVDPPVIQCRGQRTSHLLLPNHLGERGWAILPVQSHGFTLLGTRDTHRGSVRKWALPAQIFSLYGIDMPVNASQEQLDAWVAEAEIGYDPELLKKRGRGRPGRGSTPAQVVAVRLTDDELKALDDLATEKNMTRSEIIRQAIGAFTAA